MSDTAPDADIIIGVDTHKSTHAAVAISAVGARLGSLSIPASSRGYQALLDWARSLGPIRAFGVEGTGSYGAGLSRFLSEHGYSVLEVNRPSRQLRHHRGKDDMVDAESAARSVLAGQATALPKSGTSTVEMIRHLMRPVRGCAGRRGFPAVPCVGRRLGDRCARMAAWCGLLA